MADIEELRVRVMNFRDELREQDAERVAKGEERRNLPMINQCNLVLALSESGAPWIKKE